MTTMNEVRDELIRLAENINTSDALYTIGSLNKIVVRSNELIKVITDQWPEEGMGV